MIPSGVNHPVALLPAPSARKVAPEGVPAAAQAISLTFQEYSDAVELPRLARVTVHVLAALLVCGAVWTALARLDIVVAADGKLSTDQQMAVIQAYELSVVRDVSVKAGDEVKAGQIVAVLDPTITEADAEDAANRLGSDRQALARIEAEMKGENYAPSGVDQAEQTHAAIFHHRQAEVRARFAATAEKVHDYEAQLASRRVQVPLLEAQLAAATETERIDQQLFQGGNGSKLKLLDAQRTTLDARGKLIDNQGQIQSLQQQILTAKAEFDSYMGQRNRELADEYSKTRLDHDDTVAKLAKARMRDTLIRLKAPVDGTVLEVAHRPRGSVVREAETLVTIVPSDAQTVAVVQVETRDIGRIKLGDPVTMKLEALPYQQYGFLEGRLVSLTPDTLTEDNGSAAQPAAPGASGNAGASRQKGYYRAEVMLTANRLRNIPPSFVVRSGMKVSAEINVGTRSIVQYVLNPLTRAFGESMREQ